MKKVYFSLFFLIFFVSLSAQTISGIVKDHLTGEPLIGVTVRDANNPTVGTVTDIDGQYQLKLKDASQNTTLIFSYIGYDEEKRIVRADKNQKLNIILVPHNEVLDEVVVTAGRFEQRMTDVTVSMEVVRPEAIRSQAPTDLTSTLQTLPGVEIVDKQPSVRGGGGWTYSVGSRCQVLMDGMTILNPKTGEVNWNNIPLENVAQVEVIKGASSVLYGSSALNGVINVRTQRPNTTPETKLSIYTGIYDNYKKYKYTGTRLPLYLGAEASHSRRIGNFDLTAAVSGFKDEGYRKQSFNNRVRFGGNLTYHKPVENGKYLNAGLNMNYIANEFGDFFVWRSPLKPLEPSPLTNMGRKEHNFNIDPFLNFDDTERGMSHKLRMRFYLTSDNLSRPTASKDLLTLGKEIGGNMSASDMKNLFNQLNVVNIDVIKDYINRYNEGDLGFLDPLVVDLYSNDWLQLFSDVKDLLGTVINSDKIDQFNQTYNDLLGMYNNNDWLGLVDKGLDFRNTYFPNVTVENATDLIGYAMDKLADKTPMRPELTYNYYIDYQFAKAWDSGVRLTTGVNWNHITNTANITGTHHTDNVALYLQYDHRIVDRLSLSAGVRFEYYRMDDRYKEANIKIGNWLCPVRPVLRAGLNWEIYKAGFLRASFGQGYRNPSITEKFARKDIGGVGVYPNHDIKPESGYNAELGYKQLYKFGPVSGYIDFSGFFMQYKDMIEYQFGLFDNSNFHMINSMDDAKAMISNLLNGVDGAGLGIGAQFVNVNRARIYGAEVSTVGKVDIKKDMSLNYMIGYTFTEPIDLDNKERIAKEATYTDPLQMKNKSNDSKYLKYRQKHSFKASLDYRYKWFSIGTNLSWRSKILAVDYLMVDERPRQLDENGLEKLQLMDYVRGFIFGYENGQSLHTYWQEHNKGVFTMDLRMSVRMFKYAELQFMVNNLLNTEYSYRPMAFAAPRNYVCRLNVTF
ncbi:MAG: TonB-dependent receptor [Paludibacteraceae bacterium]|nr:TonB-dependent receptor [Paludibacteraceae bacterium]MBR1787059.1 TonB-dependent receptor [Paludibacteraceae bacterium]